MKSSLLANGRPAAKLVPLDTVQEGQRLGVAKGLFEVPDIVDAHNAEVAQMFLGVNSPEFPDSCQRRLKTDPHSSESSE